MPSKVHFGRIFTNSNIKIRVDENYNFLIFHFIQQKRTKKFKLADVNAGLKLSLSQDGKKHRNAFIGFEFLIRKG